MRQVGRAVVVLMMLALAHAAYPGEPATRPALFIDADFPGGNILVEKVEGDHILLRPDLRDTAGDWFYWAFRVRGAAGRTLTFQFTKSNPVGVRGPAVSLDGMKTWRWAGFGEGRKPSNSTFTYAFPADADEVYFGMGMVYTGAHLDAFLKPLAGSRHLRVEKLCETRKGRPVPRLHVGKLDGEPRHRVLVTARHHACEMMASYAVEGLIEAVLADDEAGRWLRENAEFLVVPFVDRDGVEDGDQGKNRKPRDHNRDYDGASVHRETAALRELAPRWSAGRLVAFLDLHCPYIRGQHNEDIYQVGAEGPEHAAQQRDFGRILKRLQRGPLAYDPDHDVPFGTAWNTKANYGQGMSSGRWARSLDTVKLATTFEIPYANASGKEVTADSARAFGRDVARALHAYLAPPRSP